MTKKEKEEAKFWQSRSRYLQNLLREIDARLLGYGYKGEGVSFDLECKTGRGGKWTDTKTGKETWRAGFDFNGLQWELFEVILKRLRKYRQERNFALKSLQESVKSLIEIRKDVAEMHADYDAPSKDYR